jgi:hypothetical protein
MPKTLTPKGPVISIEDMQYLVAALDTSPANSKHTPDTPELRLLYALRDRGWVVRNERPWFTDHVVENFNAMVLDAGLCPRLLVIRDCIYYKSGKPT